MIAKNLRPNMVIKSSSGNLFLVVTNTKMGDYWCTELIPADLKLKIRTLGQASIQSIEMTYTQDFDIPRIA